MRLVLAKDDPDQSLIAQAQALFDGVDEDEVIEAVASSDPWIVEMAVIALAESKSTAMRQVDSRVFGRYGRSDIEALRIKEAAARWLSCERGAPCGPNQFRELQQCLFFSNCGLGLDTRSFIQQRQLSDRDFELMQDYLQELRDLRGWSSDPG
jgi:hypothetical protein